MLWFFYRRMCCTKAIRLNTASLLLADGEQPHWPELWIGTTSAGCPATAKASHPGRAAGGADSLARGRATGPGTTTAMGAPSPRCLLPRLRGTAPSYFHDLPGTPSVDDWLRTIESKFMLLPELTEQEKVRYTAQLLQGPAGPWHATFLARQERDHVPTWLEFR